VEVSVECCPSASPEFEGRGGDELNLELARTMERYLNAEATLNLQTLCLVPGKHCWVIYVDALVLDSAGNLFDALSIATRAALLTTEMPVVTVVEGVGTDDYELELEVDSLTPLPLKDVPIFVTLTRIGTTAIVDASLEEEQCSACRISFAINKQGHICTTQKGNGVTTITQLQQMMLDSSVIGKKVIELMDKVLEEEKGRKKKYGFLHSTIYK